MPTVFLDSNIYRGLGIKFDKSLDYQNLVKIIETSGNEFGLLEIVYKELIDYYENDVFRSILSEHNQLFKRIKVNPYLDDILQPNVDLQLTNATKALSKNLLFQKRLTKLKEIAPATLLDFLIHNKRLTKNDNTRDFLILNTLISLCREDDDDYIVLISADSIFYKNDFFKKNIEINKINNLKFYKSISDFLKDFGPKFEFITPELILSSFDHSVIESELFKDIKCLPSYISKYYYDKKEIEIPEIESLTINDIIVNDYYVIKDYKTEQLTLNVFLKVDVRAIYKPEQQKEQLSKYLTTSIHDSKDWIIYSNNFDKNARPIFENSILFILEGKIDKDSSSSLSLKFIDFIPDYFISQGSQDKIENTIVISDYTQCHHELDDEHGYWKVSNFGGGLSWHMRCKKCNFEFDTGDSFD
jgi:hypothetical protein